MILDPVIDLIAGLGFFSRRSRSARHVFSLLRGRLRLL